MEKNLLFYLLSSSIPCNVMQIYKEVMYYSIKILRQLIAQKKNDDTEGEDESTSDHAKRKMLDLIGVKCEMRDLMGVNYNDVNLVMGSLGLEGWRREARINDRISENNQELQLSESVYELLEDKNASFEELKEAFYVFDRDEDGFITAFELWSVLRRLGFKEGMKYGDCEKMIRVFDQDGDDRISFQEFKNMMENST